MLSHILTARFFVEAFEADTVAVRDAKTSSEWLKRLKQTRIADALRITSREVERRIEGWPSIKGYFGEDTRIHKSLFVVQKTQFFAMKVTLPPGKDCFWEETKTNRVHFPPPSICCWLFTWHNNEKENSQIKVGKEQKGKNKRETNKQWTFFSQIVLLLSLWACAN